MKKKAVFIVVSAIFLCLSGCVSSHKVRIYEAPAPASEEKPSLPVSSRPKARLMVTDFDMKTLKVTGEVSSALRQMFVEALLKSNQFQIVDLQSLKQIDQNRDSNKEGVFIGPELPKEEQPSANSADLIISVAITEFEPHTSGGSAGVGGGGGVRSGFLGGLLGAALNKAHISLDLRIVKALDSEVLFSKLFQGQASDIRGAVMSGCEENIVLPDGLSGYTNTPMEKAIRLSLNEAVRYIADTIPANYYKKE